MKDSPLQQFKARVEEFLAETGMPISRFGTLACSDKSFVADLRDGNRDFRTSTIAKVDSWMTAERERLNSNASAVAIPSQSSSP